MSEYPIDNAQVHAEEPLDKDKVCAGFSAQTLSAIGDKIEVFQTIDSTNLEAKRRLSTLDTTTANVTSLHGTVLLAEHQSAGRGRLGRSFYSPQKKGIYVSLIYNTKETPEANENTSEQENAIPLDPSCITAATAVAVSRALSSFGIEAQIKWVNDIFINEKKICGILTEGVLNTQKEQNSTAKINTVIVGIGINVLETENGFPDELKNIAGALNKKINRNELTSTVLNNIIEFFSGSIPFTKLMDEYRERSLVLGKKVQVIKPTQQYTATVLDITDEAHLIIERADGTHEELLSGEVSLRL